LTESGGGVVLAPGCGGTSLPPSITSGTIKYKCSNRKKTKKFEKCIFSILSAKKFKRLFILNIVLLVDVLKLVLQYFHHFSIKLKPSEERNAQKLTKKVEV